MHLDRCYYIYHYQCITIIYSCMRETVHHLINVFEDPLIHIIYIIIVHVGDPSILFYPD